MISYFWYSPRGFANEGTLFSFDPENAEQCEEIAALREKVAGDTDAILTMDPVGVDYRNAVSWEVDQHPDRFRCGSTPGSFERV